MEGVVTGIVVVDNDLDPLVVLEDHGVSVLAVDFRVRGQVTSAESSVQRGDLGHDIGDIVESGLVAVVVQDAEGGGQSKELVRRLGGEGDNGDEIGIVEGLPLAELLRGQGRGFVVDDGSGDVQGQGIGHDIEHGGVHVSVDNEVIGGVSPGSDQDRVTLSGSDREAGDLLTLDIDTVHLNNLNIVAVNVEMEHGQSRHVDDTETVGLAGNKVELLVEHLVDQGRLGNGLGSTGVEDGQVLLQHDGVFSVVPICSGVMMCG